MYQNRMPKELYDTLFVLLDSWTAIIFWPEHNLLFLKWMLQPQYLTWQPLKLIKLNVWKLLLQHFPNINQELKWISLICASNIILLKKYHYYRLESNIYTMYIKLKCKIMLAITFSSKLPFSSCSISSCNEIHNLLVVPNSEDTNFSQSSQFPRLSAKWSVLATSRYSKRSQ